ncbi:MAG: SRPBCC family protein [Candidatus Thermoplasmatota archaeon]
MAVRNVHRRVLSVPPEEAEALLRSLASHEDRLWPGDRWWPQRFEGGLAPGAKGGHGPVKYKVESVAPRSVVYRFPSKGWFRGTHRFDVVPHPKGSELVHTLEGTLHGKGLLLWPGMVRPLHDALLEDVLDRAEAASGTPPARQAQHTPYVRFLRRRVLKLRQP